MSIKKKIKQYKKIKDSNENWVNFSCVLLLLIGLSISIILYNKNIDLPLVLGSFTIFSIIASILSRYKKYYTDFLFDGMIKNKIYKLEISELFDLAKMFNISSDETKEILNSFKQEWIESLKDHKGVKGELISKIVHQMEYQVKSNKYDKDKAELENMIKDVNRQCA